MILQDSKIADALAMYWIMDEKPNDELQKVLDERASAFSQMIEFYLFVLEYYDLSGGKNTCKTHSRAAFASACDTQLCMSLHQVFSDRFKDALVQYAHGRSALSPPMPLPRRLLRRRRPRLTRHSQRTATARVRSPTSQPLSVSCCRLKMLGLTPTAIRYPPPQRWHFLQACLVQLFAELALMGITPIAAAGAVCRRSPLAFSLDSTRTLDREG